MLPDRLPLLILDPPERLARTVAERIAALIRSRAAFEHWTHDASVIPIAAWPHPRRRQRGGQRATGAPSRCREQHQQTAHCVDHEWNALRSKASRWSASSIASVPAARFG